MHASDALRNEKYSNFDGLSFGYKLDIFKLIFLVKENAKGIAWEEKFIAFDRFFNFHMLL